MQESFGFVTVTVTLRREEYAALAELAKLITEREGVPVGVDGAATGAVLQWLRNEAERRAAAGDQADSAPAGDQADDQADSAPAGDDQAGDPATLWCDMCGKYKHMDDVPCARSHCPHGDGLEHGDDDDDDQAGDQAGEPEPIVGAPDHHWLIDQYAHGWIAKRHSNISRPDDVRTFDTAKTMMRYLETESNIRLLRVNPVSQHGMRELNHAILSCCACFGVEYIDPIPF